MKLTYEEINDMKKLIVEARTTNDLNKIKELKNHQISNIRRNIAKNYHTPTNIINELAFDPVLNVSYIALMNNKCTVKRDIDKIKESNNMKCVICDIPEENLDCINCIK